MTNQPSKHPNVILICTDQWRGDCLSLDGHPVVHTPHLDHLAMRGARFGRAYSATPSCVPSRASLHTGLSQVSHGRVGYLDGVHWDYPITIASEFTRHGYQTQAIGKMHVYPERSQIGFQNVVLHASLSGLRQARRKGLPIEMLDDYTPWLRTQLGSQASPHENGLESSTRLARPWDKPEYTHYTNFIATQAIDFLLRRDTRKPFFLFLSFNAPHCPFDPPVWAFEQYLNQQMPIPPVGDWVDIFADQENPYLHSCFHGQIDRRWLQRARAGYFGHITHIDHQINRVLYELRHYGLENDTYVCFTSDHGEMLGDHHIFEKAVPYEGSARVPMILTGPDGCGICPNIACNDLLIELRDVMPTLLDCAGLPIPASVEGQSFLPIARGELPKSIGWRSHLHGEHVRFPKNDESIHWITDGHDKYIWFSGSGREQLFNLDDDPQELHDLAREPGKTDIKDRLSRWRAVLIQELIGREEGFTDGRELIAGQPVHPCLSHLREQADLD